mgnify:CR=1 FL=1|tara:strand:+ start:1595 stop:1903 length:309 start_codon:yes stop_codon:yes gene_type:complete
MSSNYGIITIGITEHAQEHFVVTLVRSGTRDGMENYSYSISAIHDVIFVKGDAINSVIELKVDGFECRIPFNNLKGVVIDGVSYTGNYSGALAALNAAFNFT